jgi:hypothetical protein
MQEHVLTGRITRLVTFKLQEFGARASFTIEDRGRSAVVCAVEGDVARDFIAGYCEGDSVMVRACRKRDRRQPPPIPPGLANFAYAPCAWPKTLGSPHNGRVSAVKSACR